MANRNGEPYIPPQPLCPTERDGEEFTITPEGFSFVIAPDVQAFDPAEPVTDVCGLFEPKNPEPDHYVATGIVEVPVGTLDDLVARQIHGLRDPQAINQRAGQIFCERVKNCRGVTENGECWALGNTAMAEVFRQISEED